MIYQIVVHRPCATSRSVDFPRGFEKEMVQFLKKRGLSGSIYVVGRKVTDF